MPEVFTTRLTGWKAIVVIAAMLGITGYRVHARFRTPDDAGRDALHTWLVKDYQGLGPRGLAQRVAEYRAGVTSIPEPSIPAPEVEFASLSAHGLREIMVVRAEVTVDGGPPPDGRPIRYLDLTTKVGGGWMVLAETNSLQYYLALIR